MSAVATAATRPGREDRRLVHAGTVSVGCRYQPIALPSWRLCVLDGLVHALSSSSAGR